MTTPRFALSGLLALLALGSLPFSSLACGDKDDDSGDGGDDGSADVCYDADLASAVKTGVAMVEADGDDYQGMCNGEELGDDAPDYGWTWVAPVSTGYTFNTTGSEFDTVLTVLDGDCNGQILACNDDISVDTLQSEIYLVLEEGQAVVIVVDGVDPYQMGDIVLNIFQDI